MRTLIRRRWLQQAGLAAAGAAWPLAGRSGSSARPRIVSIGGALTETLYALGAQGDLVGVDTTSLYPATARQLPSVGYARTLSAEGVLSLAPTLVLAGPEAGPPAVLRQLQAAQIQVAILDADHRMTGLLQRTQRLAELCGRVDAGRALVTDLQSRWATTQATLTRRRGTGQFGPKVLFVLSHSMAQVQVAGRGTAADAMIQLAGARNVLGEMEGYKPLTPEAVIAAAPEVILCTDQGLQAAGGAAGLLRTPGLAQTPAGRAQRVVAMDALLLLGFGPRLPQAVATLAAGMDEALTAPRT